ncbi:MAG: hypothetical protein MRJ65_05295 [Candidatus Brocadiaceae bacterium]|nr:hypothetical protein [Candidatus Brocadiaceae bacterium]
MTKKPAQVVGNSGLFNACYKLSMLGWNVMPTSSNARGIDVICLSMDGTRTVSLQAKSLSKKNPVPIGVDLKNIIADYWIIVNDLDSGNPQSYIMLPKEIKALAHRGEKEGRVSYWLQPKQYTEQSYHNR